MKLVLLVAAIAAITIFNNKENLFGRWETRPSVNGNVTGVLFRSDFTYLSYVNKKPFTSGVYTLNDSMLTLKEGGCDYTGIYKTIFFAAGDSLKLQAVNDSCKERAVGISRLVLGRVN